MERKEAIRRVTKREVANDEAGLCNSCPVGNDAHDVKMQWLRGGIKVL